MQLRSLVIGSLATLAMLAPGEAGAQSTTGTVIRIGSETAKVVSRQGRPVMVLLTAHEGDTFELLNREADWYWVMLPPDIHGGRRSGWVHGADVEGSEYRAAAEQRALDEAQAKAAKELQKIEKEQAKAAAEEARYLKQTQEAAAKDEAERAKQEELAARQATEESKRLRDAAEQLEKARREYQNSIRGAVPVTSHDAPPETIATRSVAAADFGESVQP